MSRTDAEIIENLRNIESALSPENLTCDGELPKYMWKRKLAQLNRERRVLVKELGRLPTAKEVWEY